MSTADTTGATGRQPLSGVLFRPLGDGVAFQRCNTCPVSVGHCLPWATPCDEWLLGCSSRPRNRPAFNACGPLAARMILQHQLYQFQTNKGPSTAAASAILMSTRDPLSTLMCGVLRCSFPGGHLQPDCSSCSIQGPRNPPVFEHASNWHTVIPGR